MARAKIIRVNNEEEMWRKFLEVTNGLQMPEKQLTPKEIELISFLCTQSYNKDYLQGNLAKKTMQRFPDKNRNLLAAEKFKLKKKGWLEDDGDQVLLAKFLRNSLEAYSKAKEAGIGGELNIAFRITTKTLEDDLYR